MKHVNVRLVISFAVWLAPLVAGWHLVGELFAPEACLDFGGAFDYVNWRCSQDDQEVFRYMEVPVYRLPSFHAFAVCLALAALVTSMLHSHRGRARSRTPS